MVVSYAADGTGVERSVQQLLTLTAGSFHDFIIKHPGEGHPNITLRIPLFGEQQQPIAMVQDAKHGSKTFRNNAYSGARLLILGNYPVMYSDFRRIAFEDGPLYHRDVEKLDRQDDNAATRLFSGDTLQWLTDHYPECLGPIVYLFVFGELIDAYQNRKMKPIERILLALRAYFFMEMWEHFLEKAGYPKSKHFLSHEACDITRYLIHGLIKLVVIYRDFIPATYPLLPWLLSTEVCEHVFGLCRQIVKDFTMLDFYFMVPKLFLRLREAALFSQFSDGKARASGYHHTNTDNRDIDLVALSTYPSNDEINDAAKVAHEEAENLWTLLGSSPVTTGSSKLLPSIRSWFTEKSPEGSARATDHGDIQVQFVDEEFDSDYNFGGDSANSDDEDCEGEQIQRALDKWEVTSVKSFREEDVVNNLAFAAVALSIEDSMTM